MKYKKTLQVLIICAVCELYALLFSRIDLLLPGVRAGERRCGRRWKNAVVTGNNELFHHRGHRVSQKVNLDTR